MTLLAVVDTNVVVAALLTSQTDSPTSRTLTAMLDGTLMFVLSPALLAEYRAVLLRPSLARRHGLAISEVDELLTVVVANAIWRQPPASRPPPAAPRAPDEGDAHLWALLDFEPASSLITGDQRLLSNPSPGRFLLTPRQWWER